MKGKGPVPGARHQGKRMFASPAKLFLRPAIVFATMAVAGCSLLAPQPEPETEPLPVEIEPVVIIEAPQPVAEPKIQIPEYVAPEPVKLQPVAIVLSNSQPAYADVAHELTLHFQSSEVFDLGDNSDAPITIMRRINDSDSAAVVAIGMRAARSAVAASDKPVVFCQVFNHQDHQLVTETSRGVAAIAPLDAQLAAWQQNDPTVTRIGAIIGEGHEDLIAEAKLAAENHGVELQIHVTHSDQETLYFFRRMILDINGFWLFPDNRILSRRALKQIMDEANRSRVPVLVQNESMLRAGASVSVSTVPTDIAATVAEVVRQIQDGNMARLPAITPLSETRVRTSDTVQVVDR